MKKVFLFLFVLFVELGFGQDFDFQSKLFKLLDSAIFDLKIDNIEEHYYEGYFKTLKESKYFEKGVLVSIAPIIDKCYNKKEARWKHEIEFFFRNQERLLSKQRNLKDQFMDFNYAKPFLKILIYPKELECQFENEPILFKLNGFIAALVLDLPTGIRDLNYKFIGIWKKSESELFNIAKNNTLVDLKLRFEKFDAINKEHDFFILQNNNLFLRSSVLDLEKVKIPKGKYGTLFSIANSITLLAAPLDFNYRILETSTAFTGLNFYINQEVDMEKLINKIYWIKEGKFYQLRGDLVYKDSVLPMELQLYIKD